MNSAPILNPIGSRSVQELQPLSFAVSATDTLDIPANALTFSASNLPAGAAFNPVTGQFLWAPTEAQGPADYSVTFTVTDHGVPRLADSETVTITVIEPPRPVTVSGVEVRDGQFRFTFDAQPGKTYLVQAKNNLEDPVWVDLQAIPASQSSVEFTAPPAGSGNRYYRVITIE